MVRPIRVLIGAPRATQQRPRFFFSILCLSKDGHIDAHSHASGPGGTFRRWVPRRRHMLRRPLPATAASFSTSASADSRKSRPSPTARRSTSTNEKGAVAAAHSIGGGTLFDFSVGAKVWKNLAVGLAYSTLTNRNDAVISVQVPHPGHLRPVANSHRHRARPRTFRRASSICSSCG